MPVNAREAMERYQKLHAEGAGMPAQPAGSRCQAYDQKVRKLFMGNPMTMKPKWRIAMAPLFFAAAVAAGSARADEVPMVTGQQWTQSTEQVKRVYLIGMTNMLHVETAYQAGNAPSDAQSVIPRLAKGLKGQTLDSVREGLDRWYAANPDRLQRPVIETIWFEVVVPGLKTAK